MSISTTATIPVTSRFKRSPTRTLDFFEIVGRHATQEQCIRLISFLSSGDPLIMNLATRVVLALSLAIGLPCCGGGGGGGGDGPPIGTLSGVSIEGLVYETPTQQGHTGASGEYTYMPGETITFRVGTLDLGSVPAGGSLTLLDLCPGVTLPLTNGHARNAIRHDSAFIKLANLATLIYFLDVDSNPSNGIQVSTLLDGAGLDLTLPVDKFRSSLALRTLRKDGLALGVWGGAGHPIPLTGVVLDQLYRDLGVQHRFYRIGESTADIDDDDTADFRDTRTYDALGNRIHVEVIDLSTSSIVRVENWVYGPGGRVLQEPAPEGKTYSYTYESNGHPTTRTRKDGGAVVDTLVSSYNAWGYPILATLKEPGSPVDPQSRSWVYDSIGVLLSDIHFFNNPGSVTKETTTYDTRRNPTMVEVDQGNDGSVEQRRTMTWNAACLLTMREHEEVGGLGLESRETFTYDADGRRLESVIADLIGGTSTRRKNTYLGLATYATRIDYQTSGQISEQWRNVFDANGNVLMEDHDDDGDDLYERTVSIEYDANSWPTLATIIESGSPNPIVRLEFTVEAGTWTHVLATPDGIGGLN